MCALRLPVGVAGEIRCGARNAPGAAASWTRWLGAAGLVATVLLQAGCRRGAELRPSSSAAAAAVADESVARAQLGAGVERIERGELEEGIRALEALLTSTPPLAPGLRAEARAWLGHAHTLARDPERARAEYELALADAPDDPWLHYALGIAEQAIGDLPRARARLGRAIELDPCHVKALEWRAEIGRLLGDAAGALADLDRAVACLEHADDARLASWGASRRELLLAALDERIELLDLLGEQGRAEADRERREELRGER